MCKRISKAVKAAVIQEYHDTATPVKQIAYKYGVGLRTIYQWIGSGHDRRRHDKPRIYILLTAEETELILTAISDDKSGLGQALYDKLAQKKDEHDEYLKAR